MYILIFMVLLTLLLGRIYLTTQKSKQTLLKKLFDSFYWELLLYGDQGFVPEALRQYLTWSPDVIKYRKTLTFSFYVLDSYFDRYQGILKVAMFKMIMVLTVSVFIALLQKISLNTYDNFLLGFFLMLHCYFSWMLPPKPNRVTEDLFLFFQDDRKSYDADLLQLKRRIEKNEYIYGVDMSHEKESFKAYCVEKFLEENKKKLENIGSVLFIFELSMVLSMAVVILPKL